MRWPRRTRALWRLPGPATGAGMLSGMDTAPIVNDVHSRLNRTRVAEIARPRDGDELRAAVRAAAERGLRLSVCGGRHAMGGQQFGTDTLLVDTTAMSRLL